MMENTADLNAHLAARLRELRSRQGLTIEQLAERTGVSRSMISVIERAESSPTAAILNRLAAGLNVTLASLFADGSRADASPVARRADQRTWRDPESGYERRALSPPAFPSPIELAEVILPPRARVAYDAGPRAVAQMIWIIAGTVEVAAGPQTHRLDAGDCLAMGIDQPTTFRNPADEPARYVVALAPDPARGGPR